MFSSVLKVTSGPIEPRIAFKLLLHIFYCIHGSAPTYNISLVKPYSFVISLIFYIIAFLMFLRVGSYGVVIEVSLEQLTSYKFVIIFLVLNLIELKTFMYNLAFL